MDQCFPALSLFVHFVHPAVDVLLNTFYVRPLRHVIHCFWVWRSQPSSNFSSSLGKQRAAVWRRRTVPIWLVVTGTWPLFSHIFGIIIPIDYHIFQRGGSTTNQPKSKPGQTSLRHFAISAASARTLWIDWSQANAANVWENTQNVLPPRSRRKMQRETTSDDSAERSWTDSLSSSTQKQISTLAILETSCSVHGWLWPDKICHDQKRMQWMRKNFKTAMSQQ